MQLRRILIVVAILLAIRFGGGWPQADRPFATSTAPATSLESWGNLRTLQDHYERHGRDFAATSAEDYAAKAHAFRLRADAGQLPMKDDGDTIRVYDEGTGAFAAYNRDGKTKTFFKPGSSSYWQRQPGRTIPTPPWK